MKIKWSNWYFFAEKKRNKNRFLQLTDVDYKNAMVTEEKNYDYKKKLQLYYYYSLFDKYKLYKQQFEKLSENHIIYCSPSKSKKPFKNLLQFSLFPCEQLFFIFVRIAGVQMKNLTTEKSTKSENNFYKPVKLQKIKIIKFQMKQNEYKNLQNEC